MTHLSIRGLLHEKLKAEANALRDSARPLFTHFFGDGSTVTVSRSQAYACLSVTWQGPQNQIPALGAHVVGRILHDGVTAVQVWMFPEKEYRAVEQLFADRWGVTVSLGLHVS